MLREEINGIFHSGSFLKWRFGDTGDIYRQSSIHKVISTMEGGVENHIASLILVRRMIADVSGQLSVFAMGSCIRQVIFSPT